MADFGTSLRVFTVSSPASCINANMLIGCERCSTDFTAAAAAAAAPAAAAAAAAAPLSHFRR